MNGTDSGLIPATAPARLPAEPEIVCEDLVKIYKIGSREVIALQGLDLRVTAGEMVGIVGKSGSGKSTLLSILGGYALPSAGKVRVAGYDMRTISGEAMKGLLGQQPHLVELVQGYR